MSNSISKNFYDISIIPQNWTEKRLKNILSISENKSLDFNNEKILSLTKKGIVLNDITSNKGQIAQSYEKYIKVKKGQICMNPMDLLSGWVDISYFDGLISPAYYTFELNEEVENKFINYFLQSNYLRKTFFKLGKGVASHDNFGRWVLTLEELKNIYVFIPKIEEQKLISHYLDKKIGQINKLIDKIQKKIELLKEHRALIINKSVTTGLDLNVEMKDSNIELIGKIPKDWKMSKIKYILDESKDSIRTGPFGSHLKSEDMIDKGIRVYNQRTVYDEDFVSGKIFVSFEKFETLKSFTVLNGDILISSRGTIGKMTIVADGSEVGVLHPCLIRLRANDEVVLKKYLWWYMNHSSLFIESVKLESNSTTIDVIYSNILSEIKFPLPKIKEQQKIIEFLDKKITKIDTLIMRENQRVHILKEYKLSLISSVVTGKVCISEDMI